MRIASPLASAALLAAALVGLPSAPALAAATCQGLPVTVTDGGGTEGDDVISTAATYVNARGGDDVVCSTAPAGTVVHVVLGDGDDSYLGGPADDLVGTVLFEEPLEHDSGDDVVDTGEGDDRVVVGSDVAGRQADRVSLGEGDDIVVVRDSGLSARGELDGGPGDDGLVVEQVEKREVDVTLDLPARTVDGGGRFSVPGWESLETFTLGLRADENRMTVRGTAGPDDVRLWKAQDVDVRLGAGDDLLAMQLVSGAVRGRVDAGGGRNLIALPFGASRGVAVDLSGRALRPLGGRASLGRIAVSGFRDVDVSGRAEVTGDRRGNRISVGCGVVDAGYGPDVVSVAPGLLLDCRDVVSTVRGGAGDDRMTGGGGRQRLLGDDGRDRADGGAGRDECRAETRVRCEG